MSINLVDNAASYQTAVAATQGVTAALHELEQASIKDPSAQKVQTKSTISQLLQEGGSSSKAGMNVLIGLSSKLAGLGVSLKPEKFTGKAKEALENEYSRMLGAKDDQADFVSLHGAVKRIAQSRQHHQGNQQGQRDRVLIDQETKGTIREYAALYAQSTVSGSQETKKKLEALEKVLLAKGLGPKDFISIKTAVKASMRQEIAQQVRQAFLTKTLSKEKTIEMAINDKSLNDVLDFSLIKDIHDNKSLQALADDVVDDAGQEIKDFARTKIEEKLIAKHLAQDAESEAKSAKEVKELLQLAAKVGVNLEEFSENWRIKQFDLGIFIPDISLGQSGAGTQSDNQHPKNPYEFTQDDEKELQISRLRALYMHRALAGDWKAKMETHFKMRKLQNGLIKLGISSNEFERIEKEGASAARLRLVDMLKSILEERATLYELAGPAFQLMEKKIKGIMSNLERLGWKLSEVEFLSLRDAANIKVFDAARQEFLSIKDLVTGTGNPAIEKRYKLIMKLMKRLKEESRIHCNLVESAPALVKEAV